MNIFGFEILELIKNPLAGILGGMSGIAGIFLWKIIKKKIDPIKYAMKIYEAADMIIENIDDNIIDKIKNKKLKNNIQKDLISSLKNRKNKVIPEFIKKISD